MLKNPNQKQKRDAGQRLIAEKRRSQFAYFYPGFTSQSPH